MGVRHVLLASALLTAATVANAQNGPPAAADKGLGIASNASGLSLPVRNGGGGGGNVGAVPEPETWIFTLAGLVAAGLLRRRKR